MTKQSVAAMRAGVIEEATRRVRRMDASEIETEFAAIENGLEIRIRFIPEPFRRPRSRTKRA